MNFSSFHDPYAGQLDAEFQSMEFYTETELDILWCFSFVLKTEHRHQQDETSARQRHPIAADASEAGFSQEAGVHNILGQMAVRSSVPP